MLVLLGLVSLILDAARGQDSGGFVLLPESDGHWKHVKSYVERLPQAGYRQAPASAREAFRDLKFGVRIHWGLYSMLGIEASNPIAKMSPEERQEYQQLHKRFNPVDFNADEWMKLFERAGARVFAFTTKHTDGFSMFDTKTRVRSRVHYAAPGGPKLEECDLAYSIMETPFHHDVVKELCDAARRHGIKSDLYFCHPDWYDADFRPYWWHPVETPSSVESSARVVLNPLVAPERTPKETARMMARHRAQLLELLSSYGKIDYVCLDEYFDKDVWPELRETMTILRRLQPDVMFRCRGIGNYGDYYTPERFVPGSKENTAMPWMTIYPLAGSWSYQPDAEKYQGSDWIIRNLVDAVAKGGNFMVGIGPDGRGRFHPKAVTALEGTGAWLKVNGKAIYGTRPRDGELWKEGDAIRFTRTKDRRFIYAFCLKWPGQRLALKTVRAREGSTITMLGTSEPLQWRNDQERGLVIEMPATLQDESSRPCKAACVLQIESEDATPAK